MKCKDCKYYTIENYSCSNEKIVDTSKYWDYEDMPIDSVSISDCEQYKARFNPMPEFGCVHFTKKTENANG